MSLAIRVCSAPDINAMVRLSAEKRCAYEKAQPQFWKRADQADDQQARWFEQLLINPEYIMLCAVKNDQIVGFVIGRLLAAPAVYNPGGMTVMVDDFCVASPLLWSSIGSALINDLKSRLQAKNVVQILIVCGAHDIPKQQFIKSINLSIASEWYWGKI